jgi:hypothetical protein
VVCQINSRERFESWLISYRIARRHANRKQETNCLRKSLQINTITGCQWFSTVFDGIESHQKGATGTKSEPGPHPCPSGNPPVPP